MSVEQADVIDGVGLRPDGSAIELLISDHLEWNDLTHFEVLAAKIEAYAKAILSGQLIERFPEAESKPACINLVWKHVPNADAARFFDSIQQQLSAVGISFKQTALPESY